MRDIAKLVLTAAVSIVALSACSVNQQPPPPPSTVTVTPNPVVVPSSPGPSNTYVTPGTTTVVTPRAY